MNTNSLIPLSLEEVLTLIEFLSSISNTFLICGNFNIYVDVFSKDSAKFLSLIESCNITHYVQTSIQLHGHILDTIFTPSDTDCV